jgi:hypothetical protein
MPDQRALIIQIDHNARVLLASVGESHGTAGPKTGPTEL